MRQLKISVSITNRESHLLKLYLNDVSRFEMVSADEEVLLARKVRNGDQAALERLIKSNLRFVISVAKQYQHQGMQLEDLINEGNVGLIKAAKKFDETKGFKFISYAVWWIRQSIIAAVSTQSRSVRLPANQITGVINLKKAQSRLEQRLEREPSVEELAQDMDTSIEKVMSSLKNMERQVSIDAPSMFMEEGTLLDTLPNPDPAADQQLMRDSVSIHIKTVLENLPERERQILTMFYGLNNCEAQTLEEIADQLKLTRERIRQIKEKALQVIRNSSWGKKLFSSL